MTVPITASALEPRRQILSALLDKSVGCAFYQIDLHVHTPASRDHRWPAQTQPRDVLMALANAQLDMVAITDHFSGAWIDQLQEARRAIHRDTRIQIKVPVLLPGVEVATGGIHLTVIFPEDRTTAYVHHFLSQLGVPPASWGDPAQTVVSSPTQVAKIAKQHGGIVVGAHCNATNGVVNGLSGDTRDKILDAIDLLELNGNQPEPKRTKTMQYVRQDLRRPHLPFVLSSDAHGPEELTTFSFVKMHAPSFAGLQQLVQEPELRSAHQQPSHTETWILGVNVIAASESVPCIYRDIALRFNPDLNVIIGGRGSGKSALLDTLRYGLDDPPKTPELREREGGHHDRIRGMYGEGDIIQVFVQHGDDVYCCERPVSIQNGSRSGAPFTANHSRRIYQLIDGAFVQVTDLPGPGFEILSQNEIMSMIQQRGNLLEFFDGYDEAIDEIKEQIAQDLNFCREKALAVLKARNHEANVLTLQGKMDENDQRILEINRILESEVFAAYNVVAQERPTVMRVRASLKEAVTRADEYRTSAYAVKQALSTEARTAGGNQISGSLPAVLAAYDVFTAEVDGLTARTMRSAREATEAITAWDTRFDAANTAYRASLRDQGKEGHDALAQDKITLEAENANLKLRLEADFDQACRRPEFDDQFLRALVQLESQRSILHDARETVIARINTALHNRVHVQLEQQADGQAVENKLAEMLRGQRVPAVAIAALIEGLQPAELFRIIMAGDMAALGVVEITGTTAHKILALAESEVLFDLAVLEKTDIPQIFLHKKNGRMAPLTELSHGEKVSAILPMLMLDKALPLVIDQPEDDLDHAFITENVVQAIRQAKGKRQVITVTHNPNIPVLGDADLVIKVERVETEQCCRVVSAQGLEHPASMQHLEQLEGGAEAFEKRRLKYQTGRS